MMDNEKDLLKRLAEGDEDAFHRIFNYYYPRTMVFLSRMIADREDVRDMAQNIFIRIWLMKELKGFTQVEIGAEEIQSRSQSRWMSLIWDSMGVTLNIELNQANLILW